MQLLLHLYIYMIIIYLYDHIFRLVGYSTWTRMLMALDICGRQARVCSAASSVFREQLYSLRTRLLRHPSALEGEAGMVVMTS